MDESTVRRIIQEEIKRYFTSQTFNVQIPVQMLDGRNFQLGLTTGTKIGTNTAQKLGFHNAVPTIQSSSGNQAALSLVADVSGAGTVNVADVNANFANIQTLVNQLRLDLVNKGLIKGS